MGLLGGSRNPPHALSAASSAKGRAGCRRAEIDADSSSSGSVEIPAENSNNKSTPSSLARFHGLRKLNSPRLLHYECRDAPQFELQEDPCYSSNSNVQVMIRIRPLNAAEIASYGYGRCIGQENAHALTWLGKPESRFSFDHVACETITQEQVFDVIGVPMVENCLAGYNSCMFAYGHTPSRSATGCPMDDLTGSGKTHTILGDIEDLDARPRVDRGLTPRIIEHLFSRIQQDESTRKLENLKYFCKCSFLEIYNEQITDLLEPTSTNLHVREDHKKGVYVENLKEVEVASVQDVIALLLQGNANRKVALTNMNKESSRSHSIFTCSVQSKHLDFGLSRQKFSGAEGGRLKEAANINRSLSTLGLVIMNLVDIANGKQRHDSLGGNSKTTVIANISPSICSAMETLSTLKFAQRAKYIQNTVIINEDIPEDISVLRAQIKQLKRELHQAQYIQRRSFCSVTTPSMGSNNLRDFSESSCSDPISNSGSPFISNGGRMNSLESACISNNNCIVEMAECSMNCIRKIRCLEGVVAGALRRELAAENHSKQLSTEIEYLNYLLSELLDWKQQQEQSALKNTLNQVPWWKT